MYLPSVDFAYCVRGSRSTPRAPKARRPRNRERVLGGLKRADSEECFCPVQDNVAGIAGDPDRGIHYLLSFGGYFQPLYGDRGFIGFRFNTGKARNTVGRENETKRDANYHDS